MAESVHEISYICRFCLSQHGLIPISKATASLFTIEDIEHFTGVQISDEEQLSFAMCESCCKTLENSTSFRNTCINNDVIFKQLFSILAEAKDGPLHKGSENHINIEVIDECVPSSGKKCEDTDQMMVGSTIQKYSQHSKTNLKNLDQNMKSYDGNVSKLNTKETGSRKKHLCSICGKFVSHITYHYNEQHTKTKLYDCSFCPIKMTSSWNMKKHIKLVHEKKITKTCELCGSGFVHQNTFKAHMMAKHNIGKTYECKECSRTFQHKDSYRKHIITRHSIQKKYTCTICNIAFNLLSKLKVHQRVHSDEQPYACKTCPKRFKSQYARKTHELTHTGIRFSCNLCKQSYRYKSLLSMHYRKDHNGAIALEQNNLSQNV